MEERIALTKTPIWNRKAVNQVAGISYTYRTAEPDVPLAVGDRAPNVPLVDDHTFYDTIDNAVPTLFILLPDAATPDTYQQARAFADQLSAQYPISAKVIVSPALEVSGEHTIVDTDGTLRAAYLVNDQPLFYVLRPDRYIEFISASPDEISTHLDTFLVRQTKAAH